MVTVSHELRALTEARLRGVFRQSAVEWLPGLWAFVEGEDVLGREDSIAEIRDEGRLSALCPTLNAAERFGVLRVVLPRGADDSGFVGWLASRVKAETGSGLFVICGQDAGRGGIFDFYGVPEAAIGEVCSVLERSRSIGSLDGVVMRVVATASNAAIDQDTIFCFGQTGDSITASYGGGPIAEGWLVGTLDAGTLQGRFQYLQVGVDGVVNSGRSTGNIDRLPDGRWRLTEHFEWSSRDGEGTNCLEEVPG